MAAAMRTTRFSSSPSTSVLAAIACIAVLAASGGASVAHAAGCYTHLFSAGDSLQDTGNIGVISNNGYVYYKLPYGVTSGGPTGRASNGLLFIDYIAKGLGIPQTPYLKVQGGSYGPGVNFAITGASAEEPSVLRQMGATIGDDSLSVQVGWAKKVLASYGAGVNMSRVLFIVGEIGGDDYNALFAANKSVEQIRPVVPQVIQAIINNLVTLVGMGFVNLVVPGNLPIGCSPFYIVENPPSKAGVVYDSYGCVENLNELSVYHNTLLKNGLRRLRVQYPHVTFTYFDYYSSIYKLYQSPAAYGFMVPPTSACCGGGGPYNINWKALCGSPGSSACANPAAHISWDGAHLTQAAFSYAAKDLLQLLGHNTC